MSKITQRRLSLYQSILARNPWHLRARRGWVQAMKQLGRDREVMEYTFTQPLENQCNLFFDYALTGMPFQKLFGGWIILTQQRGVYFFSEPVAIQEWVLLYSRKPDKFPGAMNQPEQFLLTQVFDKLPLEETNQGVIYRSLSWDDEFAIAKHEDEFYSLVSKTFS